MGDMNYMKLLILLNYELDWHNSKKYFGKLLRKCVV